MRSILALSTVLVLIAGFGLDDGLKELFDGGQTYETFLEEADSRKAMWHANTENAQVPDDLLARARAVGGTWHLLAVAVDGCSDSANTIPYLAALAGAVDGLDLRIIDSRAGRALMNANPTPDGRAATPTVLLLDDAYDEAGVFIERPAPLQEWITANRDDLTDGEYMTHKFAWYDEDLGATTMLEVIELMEAAVTGN
jgi:hypothetical protein